MIAVYIDHTMHSYSNLSTNLVGIPPIYKRMMAGKGEVNMPA